MFFLPFDFIAGATHFSRILRFFFKSVLWSFYRALLFVSVWGGRVYFFVCSHLIRFISLAVHLVSHFFRVSSVYPGRSVNLGQKTDFISDSRRLGGRRLVPVKVDLEPCPRLGCRRWGSQSLAIGRTILIALTPGTTILPRQAWRTQGPTRVR